MKIFITTLAALACSAAFAQSYDDAVRFNTRDIAGTARSQAMAGAFGALGADLTSVLINPAGIASYRATELSFTLGLNYNDTETNYYGYKREADKYKLSLNQLGLALSYGLNQEKTSGVINSTLAVSYSQLANYTRNVILQDKYGYNSMLDYFCNDGINVSSYSGTLAYDAYLTEDGTNFTYNIWERLANDEGTQLDSSMREDDNGDGLVDHLQYMQEQGYKGETTVAYALNIDNIVNIGAAIGIQSLYYSQYLSHYEQYFGSPNCFDENPNVTDFIYTTDLQQNGTGVNFNLGVQVRPIDQLRVGVAIHTPTYFQISERYSAVLSAGKYRQSSPQGEYDYSYRTGGSVVASLAGIIGQVGIVSVDYETSNYAKSKFKEKEEDIFSLDAYEETNQTTFESLMLLLSLRGGSEEHVGYPLFVRLGYRLSTSPYSDGWLMNKYKHNQISGGVGFRQNNFFMDFAYVRSQSTSDHWVLPDGDYIYEENLPAEVKSANNNFVVSIGFRF